MPETTIPTTDREVAMSTFLVSCPCGCGSACTATDAGFSATTVEVAACPTWRANGITSSVVRKSWAYSHAAPEAPALMHRDGLVTFA